MPPTSKNLASDAMNNDNAAIATLGIRVTAMEGQLGELRSSMSSAQTALSSEIRNIAASLSAKIEERGKTPWAVYLSGLMAVFSLYAYIDNSKISPLKEKDQDIVATQKELISIVRNDMVPVRTHVREWQQNDERFQRLDERIRFGEGAISERLKRIEDTFNGTWSVRDGLRDMGTRIERLEERGRSPDSPKQP